jgi:RNA polymerase sigma-70 factor (ECF subfamily)
LGQLLEAFRLLLLSEARKKLPAHLLPKEGVSDLVQDTFLEAQRDFLQFAGHGEPELRTWLCRILDHNALNVIRKYETVQREVNREASIDDSKAPGDLRGSLVADAPSPSALASQREEEELLRRALARLSDKERRVIELRHKERWEFAAIGAELGISKEAARKTFARAIEKLQEIIETIQREQRDQKRC